MLQYDVSPYSNAIPSWPYQTQPSTPIGGYQAASAGQSRVGGTGGYGGGGSETLGGQFGGFGQPQYGTPFMTGVQPHLSPEQFAGSLGRQQFQVPIGSTDAAFISELARCGRGLQEVAEQFEGREPDTQRRAFFAATAHLFYAFGLLSSKGIFVPGELPLGRTRTESYGVANACREFGKQLDRFVDKYANGRGVIDELSNLVERGKICYTEITKGIEGGDITSTDQQARKKVA